MNTPSLSNLLVPFEALINRCIAQDVRLAEGIAGLSGKILQLDVTAPTASILVNFYPTSVVLAFTSESEKVTSGSPSGELFQPDGRISGSALAMIGLLTEKNQSRSLVNPAIQISGDSEFVQSVYRLFLDMEIDWQEPLSRLIGDVPTHSLENLLNSLNDFTRGTANSIKRNVDEYLHEESRMVPPRSQVETFDQDLDALRLRLDRLQARIQKLFRQLPEGDESPIE